jgi:outer membrane protein assembly factor BamB
VALGGAAGELAAEDGQGRGDGDATWSQWRGAGRDGRVLGPRWGDRLEEIEPQWRIPLGKGFPGPVVAADRVFVLGSGAKGDVTVRALRRTDGREIWRRSWTAPASVPFFARSHGDWVRSTPAYDGETLFVGDMLEVLVALDGETGAERWRIDFPRRLSQSPPPFGFASSPLVTATHVFVQAANALVKVEKKTGRIVWRAASTDDDMMSGGAFSSPILAELHGMEQIVVFTRAALMGVDPASGEVLWRQEVPNFRGMNIVTPVVHDGGVFVSQHRNGSHFYQTSTDQAGAFRVRPGWSSKGSGYMSSPVVIGGFAYLHLGNGRFSCLDLSTGQERWRTAPMGEYWSILWQDDRILALSDEGVLRMIRANPLRFELLGEVEVANASTWGHLAVAGDQLFVRELEALSVFRFPLADQPLLADAGR